MGIPIRIDKAIYNDAKKVAKGEFRFKRLCKIQS